MQVGDYIIRPKKYSNNTPSVMLIAVITNIKVDSYFVIDVIAEYSEVSKQYYKSNWANGSTITKSKSTKLYHPTLEELFIFKQLKEQSC